MNTAANFYTLLSQAHVEAAAAAAAATFAVTTTASPPTYQKINRIINSHKILLGTRRRRSAKVVHFKPSYIFMRQEGGKKSPHQTLLENKHFYGSS